MKKNYLQCIFVLRSPPYRHHRQSSPSGSYRRDSFRGHSRGRERGRYYDRDRGGRMEDSRSQHERRQSKSPRRHESYSPKISRRKRSYSPEKRERFLRGHKRHWSPPRISSRITKRPVSSSPSPSPSPKHEDNNLTDQSSSPSDGSSSHSSENEMDDTKSNEDSNSEESGSEEVGVVSEGGTSSDESKSSSPSPHVIREKRSVAGLHTHFYFDLLLQETLTFPTW